MLTLARKKAALREHHQRTDRCNSLDIKWLSGNAQHLPFPSETFDIVACAFGLRNLQDPYNALCEFLRVLKPTGCLIILEFAVPDFTPFRWLFTLYFRLVLPTIASIIANDHNGAYRYLPESVRQFWTKNKLREQMHQAGCNSVQTCLLSAGIVQVVVGRKTS
jgi:ubiquinone/menaquinone biosynthesis methyltransferase